MTKKSIIDRHILPFKIPPFISVQRDIRFYADEVAFFFTYEGQIKEVILKISSLIGLDVDKLQKLLAVGKISALRYHLSTQSTATGFVLYDFDLGIVLQVQIIDGILDVCGELICEQSAEIQMNLQILKNDTALRVSN